MVDNTPEIVIDNETGILVELGNLKQLSGAIIQLFRDEEKARRMGEKGPKSSLKN